MTGKVNENIEIIVLAVYQAGGKTGWVHLEDIALKADEIAPGKYRWEKHKKYVSDRIISSWLSDATKEKYGSLVVSRRKQARMSQEKLPNTLVNDWRLTDIGVRFAEASTQNMQKHFTGIREPEKNMIKKEKMRLMGEEAYRKYISGHVEEITSYERESFFRVNEYITGEARKEKISRLRNMFASDQELNNVISYLEKTLLEGTHG